MIVPGYYAPTPEPYELFRRAEVERRRKRDDRMRALQREVDRAKRELREYDRFLAELTTLKHEKAREIREARRSRRAGRSK